MNTINDKRLAYKELLIESLQQIVDKLSPLEGVQRISIFGSYAGGRADLFTDLDVLVIMDTEESFLDRLGKLYSLLAVPVDMDLLCYTPQEWEAMKDRPFFKRITREEKVLYEKKRV